MLGGDNLDSFYMQGFGDTNDNDISFMINDNIGMFSNMFVSDEMDNTNIYLFHYNQYMYFKTMNDMYNKMYEYCQGMANYHYMMCMYLQTGGEIPRIPSIDQYEKGGIDV